MLAWRKRSINGKKLAIPEKDSKAQAKEPTEIIMQRKQQRAGLN